MASEIGGFLRSRRARVRPQDAGLPEHGPRRVPGLRREEVARLAGVSVDYYVRLEQGRTPGVSDAVLDAVARVLGLEEVEREHLHRLARPARGAPAALPRVRPGTRRVLDLLGGAPAFVLGAGGRVLAWNALGEALLGFSALPAAQRNAVRHTFLDPAARTLYLDWPAVAEESAAYLRLEAGRAPGDEGTAALVAELLRESAEFRRLWARQDLRERVAGAKRVHHPAVGELDLGYEVLAVAGEPAQTVVVLTCEAGSATAERLSLLASWHASAGSAPGVPRG